MFISGIKMNSKKGARVSDYIGWNPKTDEEFTTRYFGLEEQGKRIDPDYDNPDSILKQFRGSLSAVI